MGGDPLDVTRRLGNEYGVETRMAGLSSFSQLSSDILSQGPGLGDRESSGLGCGIFPEEVRPDKTERKENQKISIYLIFLG